MDLDLSKFQPEQLAALKAALDGLTDTSGRSPIKPRQLHDLRLVPTKDDPRPTFIWSSESPRNAADLTRTTPYPALMWHPTSGVEIRVENAKEFAAKKAEGYLTTSPENAVLPDPQDEVRMMLEQLSEADRTLVLKAAHQNKLDAAVAAISALSDAERNALLASLDAKPAKRTA